MPRAEHSTVVRRPPSEVFAFLANAENDPRWRPGVMDISRVSGEGVGARYKQGMKGPLGRRIAADIEITELRPDELIVFRAVEGPVHPTGRYELTPADGGTQVRFKLEAEVGGIKKLMSPMVQKQMDREVGNLERLKQVLESGS
ncbi:MAG TPA: SRPBCC family protein [Gaiellaceae bacterium]|nr:SRPBCC family protein [Gaiellaceae bacterium]